MATYIVKERSTAGQMYDAAREGWAKGQAQAEEQNRINRTCGKCGSANSSFGEIKKKKRNIFMKLLYGVFLVIGFAYLFALIFVFTLGKVNLFCQKATRTVTCRDCGNEWGLKTTPVSGGWVKVQ